MTAKEIRLRKVVFDLCCFLTVLHRGAKGTAKEEREREGRVRVQKSKPPFGSRHLFSRTPPTSTTEQRVSVQAFWCAGANANSIIFKLIGPGKRSEECGERLARNQNTRNPFSEKSAMVRGRLSAGDSGWFAPSRSLFLPGLRTLTVFGYDLVRLL